MNEYQKFIKDKIEEFRNEKVLIFLSRCKGKNKKKLITYKELLGTVNEIDSIYINELS